MFEVLVARTPGVDFEDAELGESGECLGGGERDVGLDLAGLFVGDVDGADAGGQRGVDVFLEEAGLGGAVGAADK